MFRRKSGYCSDKDSDDISDSDEDISGSDEEAETSVREFRTLILEKRKPIILNIKLRATTNEFDYEKHEKIEVYTAKRGYCFNVIYCRGDLITVTSVLHCVEKVTVLNESHNSKFVTMDQLDGDNTEFTRERRREPWKEVRPDDVELAEREYRYIVIITDLDDAKIMLTYMNGTLNWLQSLGKGLFLSRICELANSTSILVEKTCNSKTSKEANSLSVHLIKEFYLLEREINSLGRDKKEVLADLYIVLKREFGLFIQNVQIYRIEIETEPEEAPEPQEPERIELEIESDDDVTTRSPTKQKDIGDKDKDTESKHDKDKSDKGKKGKKKKKRTHKRKSSKKSLPNINLYTTVGDNYVELIGDIGYTVENNDEGVKYIINEEVNCTLVMIGGEVVWKSKGGSYPLSLLYSTESGLLTIEFERKIIKLTKVDGVWVKEKS